MAKLRAALVGGLIAGTLDIIYAFIVYGPLTYNVSPERVLQSVASGWIGREAATAGGWNTALLGLGTHFGIAFVMALAFVMLASAIPALKRGAVLSGLIYGLILYVAMNYVVVPLSSAGDWLHFPHSVDEAMQRLSKAFSEIRPKDKWPWLLAGTIFTHTVLVGLPIALIAKKTLKG